MKIFSRRNRAPHRRKKAQFERKFRFAKPLPHFVILGPKSASRPWPLVSGLISSPPLVMVGEGRPSTFFFCFLLFFRGAKNKNSWMVGLRRP